MKKRILSFILVIILALSAYPAASFTVFADNEGETGECFWRYEEDTKLLVIYGEGKMGSYSQPADVPWYENRENVKNIRFEGGITSVGSHAFYGFTALETVSLPYGITELGKAAFSGCSALKSIVIHSGISMIGESAFSGCSALESITASKSLRIIEKNAFVDCEALADIYYEGSASNWNKLFLDKTGNEALEAAEKVFGCTMPDVYNHTENGLFLAKYNAKDKNAVIPEAENGIPVEGILASAFQMNTDIETVAMPKGIVHVQEGAFNGCTSLERVTWTNNTFEAPAIDAASLSAEHPALTESATIEIAEASDTDSIYVREIKAWDKGGYVITIDGSGALMAWIVDGNNDPVSGAHASRSSDKEGAITLCAKLSKDESCYVIVRRIASAKAEGGIIELTADYVMGDADGDGEITTKDVLLIRKLLAGIVTEDDVALTASDVDGDGEITVKDVLSIRKFLAGIIEEFPADK